MELRCFLANQLLRKRDDTIFHVKDVMNVTESYGQSLHEIYIFHIIKFFYPVAINLCHLYQALMPTTTLFIFLPWRCQSFLVGWASDSAILCTQDALFFVLFQRLHLSQTSVVWNLMEQAAVYSDVMADARNYLFKVLMTATSTIKLTRSAVDLAWGTPEAQILRAFWKSQIRMVTSIMNSLN